MSSTESEIATLIAKIDARDKLVALGASWVSEPDGYFLQLDAFVSQPSAEHPALDRRELALWRCGAWQHEPKDHPWPELGLRRALCEQLADALHVPLHFPPEPYPDTSRKAWWAMWDDPPSRSWHVHWKICDTTREGDERTEGTVDAEGPTPGHALEIAVGVANQTAAGDDVLQRRTEAWTEVNGHRVSTQRLRTLRARCSPAALSLLRAVARAEMKLSEALRIIIAERELPYHEAALLVVERFESELSEARTFMAVDAWARNEPGGQDMDALLAGKLVYREVDDAD